MTGGPEIHFKPHLVIVTSEVHAWAKFNQRHADKILEALNDEKQRGGDTYPISKRKEPKDTCFGY